MDIYRRFVCISGRMRDGKREGEGEGDIDRETEKNRETETERRGKKQNKCEDTKRQKQTLAQKATQRS